MSDTSFVNFLVIIIFVQGVRDTEGAWAWEKQLVKKMKIIICLKIVVLYLYAACNLMSYLFIIYEPADVSLFCHFSSRRYLESVYSRNRRNLSVVNSRSGVRGGAPAELRLTVIKFNLRRSPLLTAYDSKFFTFSPWEMGDTVSPLQQVHGGIGTPRNPVNYVCHLFIWASSGWASAMVAVAVGVSLL